jgi:hypothetical protein
MNGPEESVQHTADSLEAGSSSEAMHSSVHLSDDPTGDQLTSHPTDDILLGAGTDSRSVEDSSLIVADDYTPPVPIGDLSLHSDAATANVETEQSQSDIVVSPSSTAEPIVEAQIVKESESVVDVNRPFFTGLSVPSAPSSLSAQDLFRPPDNDIYIEIDNNVRGRIDEPIKEDSAGFELLDPHVQEAFRVFRAEYKSVRRRSTMVRGSSSGGLFRVPDASTTSAQNPSSSLFLVAPTPPSFSTGRIEQFRTRMFLYDRRHNRKISEDWLVDFSDGFMPHALFSVSHSIEDVHLFVFIEKIITGSLDIVLKSYADPPGKERPDPDVLKARCVSYQQRLEDIFQPLCVASVPISNLLNDVISLERWSVINEGFLSPDGQVPLNFKLKMSLQFTPIRSGFSRRMYECFRRIVEFPVEIPRAPYMHYVHDLYLYPLVTNVSALKARNIQLEIYFVTSDERLFIGRTVVHHHNKTPFFYEEFKVALPLPPSRTHHFAIDVYHVRTRYTKKEREQVGSFSLNSNDNGLFVSAVHKLALNNNKKVTLSIRTMLNSTIYAEDSSVETFYANVKPLLQSMDLVRKRASHFLEAALSSGITSMKNLQSAKFSTLVPYLPVLLNLLFNIMCNVKDKLLLRECFFTILSLLRGCARVDTSTLKRYVEHLFENKSSHPVFECVTNEWLKLLLENELSDEPIEIGAWLYDAENNEEVRGYINVVDESLKHSWFFFDIIVKSLSLSLYNGMDAMSADSDVLIQFFGNIKVVLAHLVGHLFRITESLLVTNLELTEARNINIDVAMFVKSMFGLLPVSFVEDLISTYMRYQEDAMSSVVGLRALSFKIDFVSALARDALYYNYAFQFKLFRGRNNLVNSIVLDPTVQTDPSYKKDVWTFLEEHFSSLENSHLSDEQKFLIACEYPEIMDRIEVVSKEGSTVFVWLVKALQYRDYLFSNVVASLSETALANFVMHLKCCLALSPSETVTLNIVFGRISELVFANDKKSLLVMRSMYDYAGALLATGDFEETVPIVEAFLNRALSSEFLPVTPFSEWKKLVGIALSHTALSNILNMLIRNFASQAGGEPAAPLDSVEDGESSSAVSALADAIFDDNGDIKAATEDKLIEILTLGEAIDPNFRQVFFLTYRSFSTPQRLLLKLITRFMVDNTEIRLRVCNAIKHWIDKYFYDYTIYLISWLIVFLENDVSVKYSVNAAKQLKRTLEKRLLGQEEELSLVFKEQPPRPLLPKGVVKTIDLNDWPLIEVARQMTLIESELFRRIEPKECLGNAFGKKNKAELAPNIITSVNHFNRVSRVIVAWILSEEDVKRRSHILKKVIELAHELRLLNNYNGVNEVISGLGNAAVHRLKKTWELVPTQTEKLYKELEALVAHPYGKLREALRNSNPPCVPYTGVYMTDLTFIEEGNKDYVGDNELINFGKRRQVARVILEMRTYQQTPYNLEEVPLLREFLTKHEPDSDNQLWSLSLVREPREKRQ